ncbi:MAG: carbonic anhydrase [Candidatus Helarchaeota archaeon]|nr:carbonic anhydrase [Candidatus Helarchaeota archaeon]
MTALDELLAGNQTFQTTYTKYAEKTAAQTEPLKKIAVLSCIDARVNPIRIFHLNIGDLIILRNAGNRISEDVVRSLIVAIAAGITEIVVLGHSDCKMTKITREKVNDAIQKLGGTVDPITSFRFNEWLGTFSNEELNVGEQVARLRAYSSIPPQLIIHGLLYDVGTGSLKVVVNGYEAPKPVKGKVGSIGLTLNMPSINMLPMTIGQLFANLKKERPNPSE